VMLRVWSRSLLRHRVLEVCLAVALGYAFLRVAESTADIAVVVLAEHAADDEGALGLIGLFEAGPQLLNFRIGGAVIVYGHVLGAVLALGLVSLAALLVARAPDGELGVCPHCLSRVPYEASACPSCSLDLIPSKPD